MKCKIFLFFSICYIFSTLSFGQIELKTYSPSKMEKDLNILLKNLEGHPDPYAKIDEESFETLVSEIKTNLKTELDEIDFYKQLSRIVASIKDGHTNLYLPKYWLEKKRKQYGCFPYEVFLTNEDELFIVKNYNESIIPVGAQILEINDIPVKELINIVNPYLSYELKSFRNDQISTNFEKMLYLIFKQVKGLKIKYKSSNEQVANLSTINYKKWKKWKKNLRGEREKSIDINKPYAFTILEDGIAKLDIFSFAVPNINKYKFFLDKTFRKIRKKNIHSLIIDVRGNYGGWPKISSELFHYIHDGYFKTMAKSSMKISHPFRRSFTDNAPSLRRANFNFRGSRHYLDLNQILRGEIGSYVDSEIFFNESPITKENEFEGDSYLLTDRKSFSAASSFASTFQCYDMGYIIGEPTGGTKIFRANAFTKRLPKSQFYLRISSTKMYTTCYLNENEPVLPHISVSTSINERIHDVDAQLNMTKLIIKKLEGEKGKK